MPLAELQLAGLAKVNRALRYAEGGADRSVQNGLKVAAEPVRTGAEVLAVSGIRNVGPTWSRMRTGSTVNSVYIAPATRRRGGSPRPNLGRLLFKQMNLALEQKKDEVVRGVEKALDDLGRRAGF